LVGRKSKLRASTKFHCSSVLISKNSNGLIYYMGWMCCFWSPFWFVYSLFCVLWTSHSLLGLLVFVLYEYTDLIGVLCASKKLVSGSSKIYHHGPHSSLAKLSIGKCIPYLSHLPLRKTFNECHRKYFTNLTYNYGDTCIECII
jgi:hypothetical protein